MQEEPWDARARFHGRATAKEVKDAVQLAEQNRREAKAFKIRLGYVKTTIPRSGRGN